MMKISEKMPKLNRKQGDGLFYLSLLMLSVFAFLFLGANGYVMFDDSGTYVNLTANMEGVMPIYPLFLHGNKLLFGEACYLYAVVIEQALLAAVCIILFVRMLRKHFALKYWEAYVCFFLALLPFTTDMPLAMTTQTILTEGIAYAVFYLFMAALLQAVWNKSWKWFGALCGITLILSLTRSQLQILFGVCGVICIYLVATSGQNDGKKNKLFLRLCLGLAGCVVVGLVGILLTSRISNGYQAIIREMREQQEALQEVQEAETIVEQSEEVVEEIAQKEVEADSVDGRKKQKLTTSQYVTLIFSRGMYEADYGDYKLFEDEQMQELYLRLYKVANENQCNYTYATPGLWMWKDIVGGIGSVGKVCFYEQNNYYNEEPTGIIYEKDYSAIRNQRQVEIGLTLLKEHFGRFLYHTLMLLPQAFISTVFFQVEKIYLLCHLITLFLYLSAILLTIWAYKDKKVKNAYGETMCAVLGTNVVLVVVISLIFFGQQRYLVYNFGIFYIAYFLLLRQLWEQRLKEKLKGRSHEK